MRCSLLVSELMLRRLKLTEVLSYVRAVLADLVSLAKTLWSITDLVFLGG